MDLKLSRRALAVSLSPTLEIFDLASEKRSQGIRLHDFGIGEPRFDTPAGIARKGIEAIETHHTRYTANAGTAELRSAVAEYLNRRCDSHYEAGQILISNGAKQSVYNAVAALIDEGDEVIIPAPSYPSYAEMIRLCGGTPVTIPPTEAGLKMSSADLEKALNSRTRLLILNQPSNPAGVIYSRKELEEFDRILSRSNCAVISDEIYNEITAADDEFISAAAVMKKTGDRLLLINGVSKSFAMTGWRIGITAGSRELCAAMNRIQNHVSGHASSISQYAAVEAFSRGEIYSADIRKAFRSRRAACREKLAEIPGLSWNEPRGAFYFFPDFRAYIPSRAGAINIDSSRDLAMYLLNEYNVVTVPGEAFSMPGFLRVSFTGDENSIREGLDVMAHALKELEKK